MIPSVFARASTSVRQLALFGAALMLVTNTASAASFDCAKAQTKVEKMVCADVHLSKLDDLLSKLYKDDLSKANAEQRRLLIAEQRHWLKHTRNICKDKDCLKLAYRSRQAGLETFYEPKSPMYAHESDKAESIKRILAKAPLKLADGTRDTAFCTQMFNDLKQMKDIRFVDPVVQTLSYEDPALDKWKRHCGTDTPPLHFSAGCVPRIAKHMHSYRDKIDTPGCYKGFGVGPFKVFELPPEMPGGKARVILYADDNFGSNIWENSTLYSAKYWKLYKPQLGGGGFAGFYPINVNKCEIDTNSLSVDASSAGRNGKNYNSVIEYKNQYFMLVLHKMNFPWWSLHLESATPRRSKNLKFCSWIPIVPKSN